jgi:tetratricopeptide (TPR) repeat protein
MKRQRVIVVCIALTVAAFTLWLYWPATEGSFLHWDDEPYIENAAKHTTLSFETIKWAFTSTHIFYYHPLTLLSHAVDCRLWGLNPAGHHATNVVIHSVNTALVVLFVWSLLETVGLSAAERLIVASGVGLVFGIHPLQVESVAWVAERKNVLCGFFSLATLYAYLRGWRWTTLALFVAALLSKPMAVSLPVVMLAMDFYPLRRYAKLGWRRLLWEKAVFVLLAVGLACVTVLAQSELGAMMKLGGRDLALRSLIGARGAIFYLWKLVWPAWLSPYYPLGGVVSLKQAEYWVPAAAVAAISGMCVLTARRAPAALAAWVAFGTLIIPVSGLFQAGPQAAADRFMYLAMLPVVLLIASACIWAWRRLTVVGRIALAAMLVCELSFFAFRTRGQTFVWRNEETMWRSVLARFPNSGLANQGLSQTLLDEGRIDEALECGQRAVQAEPWVGAVHGALANVWLRAGRYDEAAREARTALRLNPSLPQPHYVLACVYAKIGDLDRSYKNLRDFLVAQPNFAGYVASDDALVELRDSPQYRDKFLRLVNPEGPQ